MPTMLKPIDQDYRRVIPAKFSTTRKGDPITCRYCPTAIVVGRDFAAVDACSKWHNVCSVCAGSRVAQVAGLIGKVEAIASTLTGADLTELMNEAASIDTAATQAIAGDERAAVLVIPTLLGMVDKVRTVATVQAAAADPFAAMVDALRQAIPFLSEARDITFAQSLVSQWDSKGRLSDKQRPYVESLAIKGLSVQAERELTPITQAILARVPGDNGARASVRVAIPSGGHNDLDFLAVFVGRVERHVGGVNNGEPVVYPLATAQALSLALRINEMDTESFRAAQALYGREMKHCGRCGSALSDMTSRAQGFGPDCINKVVL